jgi:hypothetical protein
LKTRRGRAGLCALLAVLWAGVARAEVGIDAALPVVDGLPTLYVGDGERTHLIVNESTLPRDEQGGRPTQVIGQKGFWYSWSIIPKPPGVRVEGGQGATIYVPDDFTGAQQFTITVNAYWEWVYLDWDYGPDVVEVGREEGHDVGSIRVRIVGSLVVDLDIDANGDGAIDATDDDLEVNPGGLAMLNIDDDNTNGVPDLAEAGPIAPENDLVPIALRIDGAANATGQAILEALKGGEKARVWTDAAKTQRVDLPAAWPVGAVPATLHVEGIAVSATPQDIVLGLRCELASGVRISGDTVRLTVPGARIVADANRDRVIDETDAADPRPLRMWINDDEDRGDCIEGANDNTPGAPGPVFSSKPGVPNGADPVVNGRADLLDFFPVWLDIHDAILRADRLPGTGPTEVRLSQADGAVKVVGTDLTAAQAGEFQRRDLPTCGQRLRQASRSAATVWVTPRGVALDKVLVERIRRNGRKGVLLLEGRSSSTEPLVVEVRRGGVVTGLAALPLSISPIARMYRWINLRHILDGAEEEPTDVSEPSNWPDALGGGTHVVFVHGYACHEPGARANAAEMFKRLHQSGSRALFTGVTWEADPSPGMLPAMAYYHRAAVNAFLTAPYLAEAIRGAALPGRLRMIAHSLGAMLTSKAIKENGLAPEHCFLLNAAVAIEAYDSAARNIGEMRPALWKPYQPRLWSSEWHRLFPADDARSGLTWRGQFGDLPNTINYYSSGDEVLDNNNNRSGDLPPLGRSLAISVPQAVFSRLPALTERVWVRQEMLKGGIMTVALIDVESHGGWGFNNIHAPGYSHWRPGLRRNPWWRRIWYPVAHWTYAKPNDAAQLTDDQLRVCPFFKPFRSYGGWGPWALYGRRAQGAAHHAETRARLFGEALPALSRATGRNPMDTDYWRHRCVDVSRFRTPGRWPAKRQKRSETRGRWLHGDFRDVGYFFNFALYDDMVQRGGLR